MAKVYRTEGKGKIMDILRQAEGTPLSVPEIEARLKVDGFPLNKTTIYRNLDRLEDSGDVVKYTGDDGRKALFQLVTGEQRCDQHLHLKCVACGGMIHLDGGLTNRITERLYTDYGFMAQCRNSVIYGLCRDCMQKEW